MTELRVLLPSAHSGQKPVFALSLSTPNRSMVLKFGTRLTPDCVPGK